MTECEDGWIDDPSACGDPDHCAPYFACSCNPKYDTDHECDETCHG